MYRLNGCAMNLSEETSRACGHLADIDGETPDEPAARAARKAIRRDAEILADRMGKSVEIYAQHPRVQGWVVDVVEPSRRGGVTYTIEARDAWGNWISDGLGDTTGYATEEAAERAIESLRALGDEWAESEYRVREVQS